MRVIGGRGSMAALQCLIALQHAELTREAADETERQLELLSVQLGVTLHRTPGGRVILMNA